MEEKQGKLTRSAKESAFLATFVAMLIAIQLAFSMLAGIEIVTALFVAYALVMGVVRGTIVAVCFSLLRCLLFGFFPTVLILYLTYYTFVAILFGLLGKLRIDNLFLKTLIMTVTACICTAGFTLLDDVVTPWYYAYTLEAQKAYFIASIPVMISQVICVGISVAVLFPPLYKTFLFLHKKL